MTGRGRSARAAAGGVPAPVAGAADGTGRERWWAVPQVLLPAVAFVVAALFAAATAFGPSVPPPPPLPGTGAVAARAIREVRYVIVDELGLERPAFAEVELPVAAADDPGARLTAALALLRDERVAAGAWPPSVPAPSAFVFELDRRRVAVVDVGRPDPLDPPTVAVEHAALRSLVATARAEAGADDVRITVAGAPAASLWGHVSTAHADR